MTAFAEVYLASTPAVVARSLGKENRSGGRTPPCLYCHTVSAVESRSCIRAYGHREEEDKSNRGGGGGRRIPRDFWHMYGMRNTVPTRKHRTEAARKAAESSLRRAPRTDQQPRDICSVRTAKCTRANGRATRRRVLLKGIPATLPPPPDKAQPNNKAPPPPLNPDRKQKLDRRLQKFDTLSIPLPPSFPGQLRGEPSGVA